MTQQKDQFLLAIARIEKLSPAPVILARARKLLRDATAELSDIAALIARDPALAADIIRCANNATLGGGLAVQTIEDAVGKIGFTETIKVLTYAVAKITAGRELGTYGIAADDFWAESLFNGLFMRNLAQHTCCADEDEAYTIGLLRYIGRLAINQAITDIGAGLFWSGGESISKWEQEHTGFIQSQAGAILLAKWHFPDDMVQAVSGQDAPAYLGKPNWLAEALAFTSTLLPPGVGAAAKFSEDIPETAPAAGDFMRRHGLTPEIVQDLINRTCKDFDTIRENFSPRS